VTKRLSSKPNRSLAACITSTPSRRLRLTQFLWTTGTSIGHGVTREDPHEESAGGETTARVP
jgi:hypothetical protein